MSRKSSIYSMDLTRHLEYASSGHDVDYARPRHLDGLTDAEWEKWLTLTSFSPNTSRQAFTSFDRLKKVMTICSV